MSIPARTMVDTLPREPAREVPEIRWSEFLHRKEVWEPDTEEVLVVASHPGDEILGAGGLIRASAVAGRRVTVLSVTDGEAADTSRSDLGAVRRSELLNALRALCPIHVNTERLGVPDGAVAQRENRLRRALMDLLTPAVTLIAPFEQDGHADRDSIGALCLKLAEASRAPLARYPIWAWHHTEPAALAALEWRRFVMTPETQRAKAKAIGCLGSQLAPEHVAPSPVTPADGEPLLPRLAATHFARPYETFVVRTRPV